MTQIAKCLFFSTKGFGSRNARFSLIFYRWWYTCSSFQVLRITILGPLSWQWNIKCATKYLRWIVCKSVLLLLSDKLKNVWTYTEWKEYGPIIFSAESFSYPWKVLSKLLLQVFRSFLGAGSDGKESAYSVGDRRHMGSISGLGRSPGSMATHSSILAWRIPIDRGAWRATVHGVTQSRTRLRHWPFVLWWQESALTLGRALSSSLALPVYLLGSGASYGVAFCQTSSGAL